MSLTGTSTYQEPMKATLYNALLVGAGGALGTLFRQMINIWTFVPAWPVGTIVENLSGALLLGVVSGFIATRADAPDWLRTGVATGFCGGYTTMSTLASDTFVVAVYQAPAWAVGYVGVSLVFGLVLAWLGIRAGRRLGRRR